MSHVYSLAPALEQDSERMEQMGEYLVRRLVGEGGMGKVYEAEERLSKRRVALKVLHPELSKSEHARRLFLNEMQILARIEHPNIVRSLASIEVGGELVMVLEYLDGQTLRHALHGRGRYPWVEAVAIIASAANALVAAHGQDPPIIHRDLKPENIMVLTDGTIKVMDFGIAKVIEAMNQTNTQSVGTLQYMSPEQIDAHAIDHRSDLYCLGLILYELLEGGPPFSSSSPRQLLNMQCTADPPPLGAEVRRGLPKGVEDLLFQLLEKAAEDRPYLAEDVVARLDPFIPAGITLTGPGAARAQTANRASGPGASTPGAREREARSPGVSAARGSIEPARASAEGVASDGSAPRVAATPAGRELSAAPAGSAGGSAGPTKPSEGEVAAAGDKPPVPRRADTLALIERGERPREVPTKIAIAIIVALSLVAGLTAYYVRSSARPTTPAGASDRDDDDSSSKSRSGSKSSSGSGRWGR